MRRIPALLLAASTTASIGCAASATTVTPPSATPSAASPASSTLRQQWLDMFARGYFPGRSGQVFVVPKQRWFVTTRDSNYRFMHGSPWEYDTHIPLLLYGKPFIKTGQYPAAARQQDVAPTIGALIGAPSIPTYTGRVLTEAMADAGTRPRIAMVIVLDAMRADYFDKHASTMPTLSRMKKEGAWFSNTHTVVLPTVTGVGHANVGTGSEPRFHGIAVNTLFNRATGKSQEAYNRLDTRELMALTLADVWNLATDGRAVIIGQGGAIRATAGLVGHGACLI
ncbi:MAG TPA: alkaline phosphatase family protein, partial [Vicinamibacterales bacterium]